MGFYSRYGLSFLRGVSGMVCQEVERHVYG